MFDLKFREENYFPTQWQFLTSDKPINGYIGGFGSGKTYVFLRKTLYNLLDKKNESGLSNGWIVYPTYDLAEELFVQPFKELLEQIEMPYEYNQAKHRFTTPAGNVKIYQLQKAQRIVGSELTFIGFDEFDIESYKNCDVAFKKAIGRMRGSENCEIYIVSSPEGYHYLYKIFVEEDNEDRFYVRGKTTDNKYLPKNYIKLLESNYDDRMLKGYRDGLFQNFQQGQTYYCWNRDKNIREYKYDPTLPIHIGNDQNVDPMCSVLFQVHSIEPTIRIFDEVVIRHSGGNELLTERMCREIKRRYPNSRGFYIYPDASSRARKTSSRRTDFQIMKDEFEGIGEVLIERRNPPVVDRVNLVNKMMESLIVDPSCKIMIRDFDQVTNKPNTREIDKGSNKELSHISDALGYALVKLIGIKKHNVRALQR
tara:strand:- start:512 stop:1783 length:1272 start_codon:yes stop_codon:yes gene_type:complete